MTLLLGSFVVAMLELVGAHRVSPPGLNGCAVFAHKHALAQAHACGGGKCIAVGKVARTGQPKAGGSEYLELHEAFSIGLRAPGETPQQVWFLDGREARELQSGRCGVST